MGVSYDVVFPISGLLLILYFHVIKWPLKPAKKMIEEETEGEFEWKRRQTCNQNQFLVANELREDKTYTD